MKLIRRSFPVAKGKTQLVAESLSFASAESLVSLQGRLVATDFITANPDEATLLIRMKTCHQRLYEIIQEYSAHSIGFGIGSLASEWSMREVSDF